MDDIKLFAKNEKILWFLLKTIRLYNQNIGLEFAIEECDMLIMRSRNRQTTEGIELLNQEKIRTVREKETYKYLGLLEADTIKQAEMTEKIEKEYFRRTRKILETI